MSTKFTPTVVWRTRASPGPERAFRSRERALRAGLEIDRVVFDALVALRAR